MESIRLTPREREVLHLVAHGLDNRAVARRLEVTETAVEKHIGRIFRKLGVARCAGRNPRILATLHYHGVALEGLQPAAASSAAMSSRPNA